MPDLPHSSRELWWAFFAALAITLLYLFVTILWRSVPAASSLFGHALGIVGFVLMLMTETLYSLRKRSRNAGWGRMSAWMQFHIFTGLVGPYMVLLHSAWKFNGLAGLITLLTALIVASGFVGRYIYTAIPRTADGIELKASELIQQIAALEQDLRRRSAAQPQVAAILQPMLATDPAAPPGSLGLGPMLAAWQTRRRWTTQLHRLAPTLRQQAQQWEQITRRRQQLRRQMASLARSRQLLALWHALHVPVGITLFLAAFIHAAAAFYFATLLH